MTASSARKLRQADMMLAFAVSVSVLSTSASFAFSAEAQQMCTGDAFRLCSSDIPNIAAITACMVKHRTELSRAAARSWTAISPPRARWPRRTDEDGFAGGGAIASRSSSLPGGAAKFIAAIIPAP